MKCPAFDETIEAADTSGDGLGAGRLITARGISRPSAQLGHDPGEPGQTPLQVRVLQLFSSPFELSVERRQRGLVRRIDRIGQDQAGLAVIGRIGMSSEPENLSPGPGARRCFG